VTHPAIAHTNPSVLDANQPERKDMTSCVTDKLSFDTYACHRLRACQL